MKYYATFLLQICLGILWSAFILGNDYVVSVIVSAVIGFAFSFFWSISDLIKELKENKK